MNTRTIIDVLKETATVEQLVIEQVPVVEHALVDAPSSTTDWSFMSKQRVVYNATEDKPTWVVVEVRKATEEEIDTALDNVLRMMDL